MTKGAVKMTEKEQRRANLDALANDISKSFGKNYAKRGGLQRALNTVPTGSLALDFELGVGGWPRGYLIGVFGPRDIGKSSMIGLNAIRNAQALGLNCAWVALEDFSEPWAEKNGVSIDDLLLAYPQTGEEAFGITLKLIKSEVVDFIVFDSIGAVLSESELDDDGKMKMGGQAGLITWFVKAAAPAAKANNVGVILLNQVRDNMKSRIPGLVQQPGGNALEHMEHIIVQLKRGKNRYMVKEAGTEVQVGQEIVAHILRNKAAEGTGKKAQFDYFFAETEKYPFGIDQYNDVLNTSKRTGVIVQRGSMYDLPNGKSIKSWDAVVEYLDENPDVVDIIREAVLAYMLNKNARTVLPGDGSEIEEVEDGAVQEEAGSD